MTAPRRRPGYTQPHDWKRTRQRILERDAWLCYICHHPGADTVDHVTPVSQGGHHGDSNLAAAHSEPCHAAKTERERRAGLAARARRRPPRKNPNVL